MKRLWFQILCCLGFHAWRFQTGASEEIELRECIHCREWEARIVEARDSGLVFWSPWEPYERTREPWGPVA